MDKRIFKKSPEELQLYLSLMRKHGVVPSKKGKGSFKRKENILKGVNIMIQVIIEKLNERYLWIVKVDGIKQRSGLEESITDATQAAEVVVKEFE